MKKRLFSMLLSLCMVLTLFPVSALAAEGSEVAEPEQTAVEKVQAMLDALPTAEELEDADEATVNAAYEAAQDAYDALEALSPEELEQITGVEKLTALMDWFNGQVSTLDDTITTEAELKAAVAKGGTVTLGANIALTSPLEVNYDSPTSEVSLTLNMNGYTLTGEIKLNACWFTLDGRLDANVTAETYVGSNQIFASILKGGTYAGSVVLNSSYIESGIFTNQVTGNGYIRGGIFYEKVVCADVGQGIFYGGCSTAENVSFVIVYINDDKMYAKEYLDNDPDSINRVYRGVTNPGKKGCTFLGWYEKDENGDFKDNSFNFQTMSENNFSVSDYKLTLYAKWKCNGHSGGTATCKDRAICDYCQQQYGEKDSSNHVGGTDIRNDKAANCTEDGYTGDTYCKGCGDTLSAGKPIPAAGHNFGEDGKCACGAVKFTVTFDPNGGTVDPTSATTDVDGNLTLTELPTPTRSGSYHFDGWFTEKNGGTKASTKTTFTAHTTLYAHWTYTGSSGGSSSPSYSVTAPETENGSVTVSPKRAEAGSTVTITVTPDSGYTLETLTVLDKNGNEIELTAKGDGKYTFKMPSGKVEIRATFMEDNTILNFFVDVTADKYYYDAVLWAAKNGITGGIDENHFGPDLSCTRAQLVTFLWRAAGSPAVNYAMDFSDVDANAYYGEAIRWANSLGIVGGYGNGLFGTDDTITREQMAVILYRFAQAMGMDTTQGGMAVREFADYESISGYATEAMQWAVNAGILQGSDGKLMPGQPCTRAQIVTMMWRLLGE